MLVKEDYEMDVTVKASNPLENDQKRNEDYGETIKGFLEAHYAGIESAMQAPSEAINLHIRIPFAEVELSDGRKFELQLHFVQGEENYMIPSNPPTGIKNVDKLSE